MARKFIKPKTSMVTTGVTKPPVKPDLPPTKPKLTKLDKQEIRNNKKVEKMNKRREIIETRTKAREQLAEAKLKEKETKAQLKKANQSARKDRRDKLHDVATRIISGEKVSANEIKKLPGSKWDKFKYKMGSFFKTGTSKTKDQILSELSSTDPTKRVGHAKTTQTKIQDKIKLNKANQKWKVEKKRRNLDIIEKVAEQGVKNAGLVGAATALAAPAMVEVSKDDEE